MTKYRFLKSVFSISIIICMILSFSTAAGASGSYFLSEDFYYGVKNKEAYVHGYEGNDWDIVIREKFLNYPVTSVEEYAFFENDTMQALSFYDALYLKSIGDCAFSRCTGLQYVNITSTVEEMGTGVFDGCTSLYYARFREGSLKDIPAQTFYGCESLGTVVFENEPESIGNLAFANCTSLYKFEIPDSVTYISDNAFDGSDNLLILCTTGSYAQNYAEDHDIDYILTDLVLIKGDANADGDVSISDVTLMQRYFAGFAVDDSWIFELCSDVDGEGVSVQDASYIQRYMAKYSVPYDIGSEIDYLSLI